MRGTYAGTRTSKESQDVGEDTWNLLRSGVTFGMQPSFRTARMLAQHFSRLGRKIEHVLELQSIFSPDSLVTVDSRNGNEDLIAFRYPSYRGLIGCKRREQGART